MAEHTIMTQEQLAKYFDHTLLLPYSSADAFQKLCADSVQYGFKMVAINPAQTLFCKSLLRDTEVHVGAAIGFPLGQSTLETKMFETLDAITKGADEIDYVVNVSELKNKNDRYIELEMKSIVEECRKKNVISKVIFENCFLTDDEKEKLCSIANIVQPDFIKTSTGFGTGGAVLEDVVLMRQCVNKHIKVKASGGIKNLETVMKMIQAGAERIGTSASVEIMKEFNALQ